MRIREPGFSHVSEKYAEISVSGMFPTFCIAFETSHLESTPMRPWIFLVLVLAVAGARAISTLITLVLVPVVCLLFHRECSAAGGVEGEQALVR